MIDKSEEKSAAVAGEDVVERLFQIAVKHGSPVSYWKELRTEIAAEVNALLRAPEAAPGWQKIETAPKDGRGEQIIAFIPWSNQTDDNDRGYVATVYWDPGYEGAPDSPAYEATWVTFAGCNHVKPTHWMPLPPAPSAPSVDSGVSEREKISTITWHSSDDDGLPDCGLSFKVAGDGPISDVMFHIGEISTDLWKKHNGADAGSDGGWWLTLFGENDAETKVLAKFIDHTDAQQFIEWLWALLRSLQTAPALPVADARNEGIEEAAKWHDVRAAQNESWADAAVLSDEGELRRRAADYRECAAAIRALKSPPAEGAR